MAASPVASTRKPKTKMAAMTEPPVTQRRAEGKARRGKRPRTRMIASPFAFFRRTATPVSTRQSNGRGR
jgi:hypothetical protein